MVNKVNNQLMPFTSFGGNCYNCTTTRRRVKRNAQRRRSSQRRSSRRRSSQRRSSSRGSRGSQRRSSRRRSSQRRSSRRRSSRRRRRNKMNGGFIRSGSRVLNWGDTCKNTGTSFNLEY